MRTRLIQFWRNRRGQDLIEYALLAGLVAMAAGAIMPSAAASLAVIHSKIAAHASRVAGF